MDGCGATSARTRARGRLPGGAGPLRRHPPGFLDESWTPLRDEADHARPPKPRSTPASHVSETARKEASPSSNAWAGLVQRRAAGARRWQRRGARSSQRGLRRGAHNDRPSPRARCSPAAPPQHIVGSHRRIDAHRARGHATAAAPRRRRQRRWPRRSAKCEQGRLSLDMLQRFGEGPIEAVNHLEAEGRRPPRHQAREHRASAENRTGEAAQPVLFDFAVRTPADNAAGTHPLPRPPVPLSLRKPPPGTHAERLAASFATLYEMGHRPAAGVGDGRLARDAGRGSHIESDVRPRHARRFTAFRQGPGATTASVDAKRRRDAAPLAVHLCRAQDRPPGEGGAENEMATRRRPSAPWPNSATAWKRRWFQRIGPERLRPAGGRSHHLPLSAQRATRCARRYASALRSWPAQGDPTSRKVAAPPTTATKTFGRRQTTSWPPSCRCKCAGPPVDDRLEEVALAHYLPGRRGRRPAPGPPWATPPKPARWTARSLTTALIKVCERWLRNTAFTELRQQLETCCAATRPGDERARGCTALFRCVAAPSRTTPKACARPARCAQRSRPSRT